MLRSLEVSKEVTQDPPVKQQAMSPTKQKYQSVHLSCFAHDLEITQKIGGMLWGAGYRPNNSETFRVALRIASKHLETDSVVTALTEMRSEDRRRKT